MDLAKYLYINEISKSSCADFLGISYVTMVTICAKKCDLKLTLAAKIVELSKGEVSWQDLLPNPKKQMLYKERKEKAKKKKKEINDDAKLQELDKPL